MIAMFFPLMWLFMTAPFSWPEIPEDEDHAS